VDKVLELFVFSIIWLGYYVGHQRTIINIQSEFSGRHNSLFTCPQSSNGIRNITVTNDNILFDLFIIIYLDHNRIHQPHTSVWYGYGF